MNLYANQQFTDQFVANWTEFCKAIPIFCGSLWSAFHGFWYSEGRFAVQNYKRLFLASGGDTQQSMEICQ
jgi:hypothetical protein